MTEVLSGTALEHWRWHPQRVKGYVVVWEPARVVRRRVDQASFSYPLSALTVDNPDGDPGSTSDVEAGMMVHVLDSDGVEKGWGRILKAVSGSTLYLHPVGRGDIDFAGDDILDVFDHYVPYALVPYIDADGTLYKDYDTAYSDQTENFPPVANAGPARAGFVDDDGVLTVELDASGSYAVADGASLASYLWDVKDGTVTSGSTTSASLTVAFPAGKRWVRLTVTDSNGKTALARVPVHAADRAEYAPYQATLSRRGYTHLTGWEASFALHDADVSAYPEHALVIYWEDERFGTHRGSLNGCSDAEHVKFVGYVTNELITINAWTSDNVINARSPLALLANRPAFPQTAKREASPSTWAEVKGLTWWKMVVYLLKWHSNILELCDLERPAFYGNYDVVRLDSELGSLYDQVAFLARAVSARCTCDRQGRFTIRRIPHLMTGTERANWTPLVALTSRDLADDGRGAQFERPGWDRVAWLRASAIVEDPSTPTAVLAVAPGETPGQGLAITTFDRLLVTDQSDLNVRTGHEYAYQQSRRDGRRVVRRGTLTLAHRGDVIDPAWQRVVTLTLDAGTNRRGLAFDAARMVPVALDVAYDHRVQASRETLTLEAETRGAPATTQQVPAATVNDYELPPYTPPVHIAPAPGVDTPEAPSLVYAADETEIRRTEDFTAASPTWTSLFDSTTDVGASYKIYAFRVDKHAPKDRAAVIVSDGSATRIYLTEDLSAASPTWTLKQSLGYGCTQAILYSAHGEGTLEESWVATIKAPASGLSETQLTYDFSIFSPNDSVDHEVPLSGSASGIEAAIINAEGSAAGNGTARLHEGGLLEWLVQPGDAYSRDFAIYYSSEGEDYIDDNYGGLYKVSSGDAEMFADGHMTVLIEGNNVTVNGHGTIHVVSEQANLHRVITHDHWDTVTDDASAYPVDATHGMDVSGNAASRTAGVIVVSALEGYALSEDYGNTFPTGGSVGSTYPPTCIVLPWIGNDDEDQFFLLGGSGPGDDAFVKYTADGGVSFTDITPSYDYGAGATKFGGGRRDNAITHILHTYTPDPDELALLGAVSQDKVGSGVDQRFFRSADRGSSWTMQFALAGYTGHAVGGWPYDADIFFISCSDRLLYTADSGVTVSRKEWTGYTNGVWCEPIWIA